MIMRKARVSTFALLVSATVVAFVACKSGGASGTSATSSASLFERQPKRGELTFAISPFAPNGQPGANTEVSFIEIITNDGGPNPDLDGGSPKECEPVLIGPCVVTSCVQGAPVGGGQSHGVAPAGDITITDTTSGKSQVFTAASSGYQNNGQSGSLANPGDSVTFSAAGGEVPAFSQTLVAPLPVTPNPFPCPDAAADSGVRCSVSRSQDLSLGWSGGDQGNVEITLSAFGAGCNNAQSCPPLQSTAVCKFDVTVGSATIPKEVLARFPESNLTVTFASEETVDFTQGGYVIRVATITRAAGQLPLPLVQ